MAEMGSINIPLTLDDSALLRTLAEAEDRVRRFREAAASAGLVLPKQPDPEKLTQAVEAVADQIIRISTSSATLSHTGPALRNLAEAVLLLRGGVCGPAEEVA